ncbi:hypothetical protein HDU93_009632 [Gonapodya sp. JEL0774]|nr:hypothetical protein HDU93_009632 [Gonapodya sp. JEL0774]
MESREKESDAFDPDRGEIGVEGAARAAVDEDSGPPPLRAWPLPLPPAAVDQSRFPEDSFPPPWLGGFSQRRPLRAIPRDSMEFYDYLSAIKKTSPPRYGLPTNMTGLHPGHYGILEDSGPPLIHPRTKSLPSQMGLQPPRRMKTISVEAMESGNRRADEEPVEATNHVVLETAFTDLSLPVANAAVDTDNGGPAESVHVPASTVPNEWETGRPFPNAWETDARLVDLNVQKVVTLAPPKVVKKNEMRGRTGSRPFKLRQLSLPAIWEVDERDVFCKRDQILGTGGYGTVWRGLWLKKVPVAVKTIDFQREGYSKKEFNNEAAIWFNVTSPRVLPLYGVIRDGLVWTFISPIMENGDAQKYLKTFPAGPQRAAPTLILLRDFAEALEYLHGQGVVHCDVKPQQLLVSQNGRGVITDFGFAKSTMRNVTAHLPVNLGTERVAPLESVAPATTSGEISDLNTASTPGTASFMSPERLAGEGPSMEDDVYAFGISIYAMWTQEEPYKGLTPTVFQHIIFDGMRPSLPQGSNMPLWLQTLMNECLLDAPQHRPTFSTIKQRIFEHVSEPKTPEYPKLQINESDPSYLCKLAEDSQDLKEASQLLLRAAELSNSKAQERLAFYYQHGLGVLVKDFKSAILWYNKAATNGEFGNLDAQFALGTFFYNGECGVDKDLSEAEKWFEKAINVAKYELGVDSDKKNVAISGKAGTGKSTIINM